MSYRRSTIRFLAGVLAASLLAACSNDEGGTGASDITTTTSAPTTTEPPSTTMSTTTVSASTTSDTIRLPATYEGFHSDLYADEAAWLCRPGRDDVCATDLDATVVHADGTTELQPHQPAVDAPVDCFYVYPTVSKDPGPNSDLEPGEPDEIYVTVNQAARLTTTCRVFAPLYRQLTLSMIGGSATPEVVAEAREVAYGDVVDAFRHYVANDSDGRGFVLVGHSQGAGHLRRLIAEEIDGEALLRDRLVGAYLLGTTVAVPEGRAVGGDFDQVPLCEAAGEVGCVVTYASFRATAPPPENSRFGRVVDREGVAGCVNPASPAGGPGVLQPYVQVEPTPGALGPSERLTGFADPAAAPEITTRFITLPDFVEAECVSERGFSYLALTVKGDPSDPRVDDITGDLTPEWGMHLVDVNVAMGNLVDLVSQQAAAFSG